MIIAHFLQALGYSSMAILPVYLEHLDANRAEISLIMSVAAISGLLSKPLVGWGLDVLGRKPTLIAGTLVLVAGMAMIGAVDSIGALIVFARFTIGVGVGVLFASYFTYASDLIPESRRTEGIAIFGVAGLLPLALNPFYSGAVTDPGDLRWVYPLLASVILFSIGLIAMIRDPGGVKTDKAKKLEVGEVARALTVRRLRPVWLSSIVFAGLVALYMTFATVTAAAREIESPAMMWLTYAAGAIGVRLVGAKLPDRVGTHNVVAPALGMYVMALLLTAEAETQAGFLVAGLLAGFGHGYCFPVLASQVVTRSPDRLRGSALAMFTAVWELSRLLLTPIFGFVADGWGDSVMFALASLASLTALSVWAVMEHRCVGHEGCSDSSSQEDPEPDEVV